jgi:membrane protein DedA with SNARE-associated domain
VIQHLDELLRGLGPSGYALLGAAALIEYVFPPFPGDTVTLLGGAYVARAERSMAPVIAVLTLGSALGITATWRVGRAIAGRLATVPAGSRLFGLKVEQLRRAQVLMKSRGSWLLVANRFLPSFRTVVFIAAGASGVSLSRALALGLSSALAWNTLLVAVGFTIGDNAEVIERFFVTYRTGALAVFGLVALGIGARYLWTRRRAPPQAP